MMIEKVIKNFSEVSLWAILFLFGYLGLMFSRFAGAISRTREKSASSKSILAIIIGQLSHVIKMTSYLACHSIFPRSKEEAPENEGAEVEASEQDTKSPETETPAVSPPPIKKKEPCDKKNIADPHYVHFSAYNAYRAADLIRILCHRRNSFYTAYSTTPLSLPRQELHFSKYKKRASARHSGVKNEAEKNFYIIRKDVDTTHSTTEAPSNPEDMFKLEQPTTIKPVRYRNKQYHKKLKN